jgi:NADPH2:quinone reductase
MMRAITINKFGGIENLALAEVPIPEPGDKEVLIRVKAAGVNPVDCKIREGKLAMRLPHRFPLIPGWDAAGVVTAAGPGVTRFKPGDEVFAYCRKPVVQYGAYADYIVLPELSVAGKPRSLSFEEAASIPLAALTAYQSLFEALNLHNGETILIQAAAGGVGGFAVQLAALQGASVVGTARGVNHDYVLNLGAERVIDYTVNEIGSVITAGFPDGIDAVIDTIGGEATFAVMDVLKRNGRMVSITTPKSALIEEMVKEKNIRYEYVFVRPEAGQLEKLASLIDAGKIRTHLSTVLPLEDAAEAHRLMESGHTKGKIVLTL